MVALVLVLHLVAQDTYAEIARDLPKDKARRASVLLKFAENADASIPDRLRALKGAAEHEPKKTAAAILEAKLHGAVGKRGPRASAWMKAAASARKRGDPGYAAYIDRAREGDDAVIAFAKLVAKAQPAPDAGVDPIETKHVEDIERAIDAWTRLGDTRAAAEAKGLMAQLKAARGDVEGAAEDLRAVVAKLTARDAAITRSVLRKLRATWLESLGRMDEAVAERLGAERDAAIDLRVAVSQAKPSPYIRTRETAAWCKKLRGTSTSCTKIEQKKYGGRTFYDFSKDKGATFASRADDVLAEYEGLIHDCIQVAAKERLVQQTNIELEWAVTNGGRVASDYHLFPMRLRRSSFDKCLKEAFAMFRYPPYSGEMQHVRLTFEVGGDL